MYQMTEEEKRVREEQKAFHKKIRQDMAASGPCRDMLLLWGFVRGFKYRRIERKCRIQVLPDGKIVEHNKPNIYWLGRVWGPYLNKDQSKLQPEIEAWLKDPSGAIPEPARVKKRYVPQEAAISAE